MEFLMSHVAYLSLGSNLGDRAASLQEALHRLRSSGEIMATSSLYETKPLEVLDQPWFLNAVAALRTEFAPDELLRRVLLIEQSMGRVRTQPKGPRTIDIDILLYDDQVINLPGLNIPHPGIHQRLFVLAPLAEIAPKLKHPTLHRTVRELRDSLTDAQQVRALTAPWASSG